MAKRDYVTVVSGLPRSGTSMMMKMISEGGIPPLIDNIRKADDDNPLGYFEFEPVKKTKEDSSWVPTGVGKAVKMVHLLLLDLPLSYSYRVIFMRRHLDEVVQSQNVMLDRHKKNTDALPAERLKEVYGQQIEKVFQHMRKNAGSFRFMEADYNVVLKEPQTIAEKISRFLDGMDVEKMTTVVDPKLYRNRRM